MLSIKFSGGKFRSILQKKIGSHHLSAIHLDNWLIFCHFFSSNRCKMRQKDPRLFYLTMEVTVRKAGVKTVLALDDEARPAILQACHPKGDSRFCLQTKPGGLIRVHTSTLEPTSLYKSLFISEETSSDELLILLLSCFNSTDPVEQYSLYEVSIQPLDCTHSCCYFSFLDSRHFGTFVCT